MEIIISVPFFMRLFILSFPFILSMYFFAMLSPIPTPGAVVLSTLKNSSVTLGIFSFSMPIPLSFTEIIRLLSSSS